MKVLISLALLALAHADQVRVVIPGAPLLPTRASMGQYIVPNYVIDAVKVAEPVVAAYDDDGLKVRFVDAPLAASESVKVVEEFSAPEPVKLGEAPAPAFETAETPIAVEAIKIAEPTIEEVAEIYSVKIAEAPLPVEQVDAVRFADAPLEIPVPEPVRIAEAPLPVQESAPEAVKIAVPDFRDYRGKVFDDPLLR